MKPVITKFNDKTGDFEITIPVPFTLKDGIEYVYMMAADIPKYEDAKDYNVFELIRENQELKKQLEKKYEKVGTLTGELLYEENTKLINQQKEFIKWLEKEIKTTQDRLNKYNEKVKNREETDIEYYESIIDERIFDVYEKNLSKYKEIVGYKE